MLLGAATAAAILLAAAPAHAEDAVAPQALDDSPPPRDATAPVASLDVQPRLRLRVLRRGLSVRYSVDEACLAVARIRVGRTVLATARTAVSAAGAGELRLALTRAGRAALPRLRDRGRSGARVELSATDAAGNRTIVGKRVTLRR
jgi:hypothetical protein